MEERAEEFETRRHWLNYVATVESEWWKKWVKEVMPTLLPYTKWKKEQKNLRPGDIVLMRNVKDDYRLALVEEVHPDEKNLVRTVTVKFKRKNKREPRMVCKSKAKDLIREKVAVQRLHYLASTGEDSAAKKDVEDEVIDEKTKEKEEVEETAFGEYDNQ